MEFLNFKVQYFFPPLFLSICDEIFNPILWYSFGTMSCFGLSKIICDCSGLELYSYSSESQSLHLVETKKQNISWYIYTHESRLVLLASGMQCKSFTGYQVGAAVITFFLLYPKLASLSIKRFSWNFWTISYFNFSSE